MSEPQLPPGMGVKTKRPSSRGAIICDACFTTVPTGVEYRRDTWKDGSYHWSVKYCPDCEPVLPLVEEAAGRPGPYWAPDYELLADMTPTAEWVEDWERRAYPQ